MYSFYRNHTERKERENFLKHYHGEYTGHSGGNDDVTYQLSKGVSFSHGSITAPYAKVELKWNAVEKRVSAMIAQGRFLTDEDRAAMPQYEKHQLARNIRTFFENVPQEQPHPYPFGFDYWDAVKLIEPQLDDPARVEEIYQMMVPVWEATPQDDRMYALRQQAFENLTAFRQGTFTLFAEHKDHKHLVQILDVQLGGSCLFRFFLQPGKLLSTIVTVRKHFVSTSNDIIDAGKVSACDNKMFLQNTLEWLNTNTSFPLTEENYSIVETIVNRINTLRGNAAPPAKRT